MRSSTVQAWSLNLVVEPTRLLSLNGLEEDWPQCPEPCYAKWDLSCLHEKQLLWFGEYLQCSKCLQSTLYTNYLQFRKIYPLCIILFISPGRRLRCQPSMARILMRSLHRLGAQRLHSLHHTERGGPCNSPCPSFYCSNNPILPEFLNLFYLPTKFPCLLDSFPHVWDYLKVGRCLGHFAMQEAPATEKERPAPSYYWAVLCRHFSVLHKLRAATFSVPLEPGLNWAATIQEVEGSCHTLDMMYQGEGSKY